MGTCTQEVRPIEVRLIVVRTQGGSQPEPAGVVAGQNQEPAFHLQLQALERLGSVEICRPSDRWDSVSWDRFARGGRSTDVVVYYDASTVGHPASWVGGTLVSHEKAAASDPKTVVTLRPGDGVAWTSDVDFAIYKIELVKHPPNGFGSYGDPPDNPFGDGILYRRSRGKSIVGRPVDLGKDGMPYGQLYKVSFTLWIDGQPVLVDPDTYCDMG